MSVGGGGGGGNAEKAVLTPLVNISGYFNKDFQSQIVLVVVLPVADLKGPYPHPFNFAPQ